MGNKVRVVRVGLGLWRKSSYLDRYEIVIYIVIIKGRDF